MAEAPVGFIDAKVYFRNKDAYPSPYNYFLTRYSSPYRILVTTTASTTIGAMYGISWALFKDQSKLKYFLRCGVGAFGLSLFYSTLNEIGTGFVKRNYGREQFFVSNFIAALPTIGLLHVFQFTVMGVEQSISMRRSLKYIGLMGLFNMLNEVLIIKQRDHFLQRNYKIEFLGMKKPSETQEAPQAPKTEETSEVKPVKYKASTFKDIKKIFEEEKKKAEEEKKIADENKKEEKK